MTTLFLVNVIGYYGIRVGARGNHTVTVQPVIVTGATAPLTELEKNPDDLVTQVGIHRGS